VVAGKKLMIRRDAKHGNRYYLADASIENGGGAIMALGLRFVTATFSRGG
jgi:hypothetical protein